MSVNNGEDTSVVGNSDWLKTLVNMNTSECLHSVKFLISCNTFLKKKKESCYCSCSSNLLSKVY